MKDSINIHFTRFKSKDILTKSYQYDKSTIKSTAHAHYREGIAYFETLNFKDLPRFLQKASSYEAISSGVFDQSKYASEGVSCVTKGRVTGSSIARTKEYIRHENNPGNGLIILDIDTPNEGRDQIKPNELYDLLCGFIKGFERIPCFSIGSSSARIVGLNKSGYRFYIPTSTPNLIPWFMDQLHQRLWLENERIKSTNSSLELGFISLAKNGNLLEKSVIDLAMKSAHQLDFCGLPVILSEGIRCIDLMPTWYGTSIDQSIDESAALNCNQLKPLSGEEIRLYKRLTKNYKKRMKKPALMKELEFKDSKFAEFISSYIKSNSPEQNRIKQSEFNHSYKQLVMRLGCTDLFGPFMLHFDDGEQVLVSEVLKNQDQYNEKMLADPIEGKEYASGTSCAIFYSNSGKVDSRPFIYSHAHGGVKYFLHEVKKRYVSGHQVSVEEATKQLKLEIRHVFAKASEIDPCSGSTVIRATPGLGKSSAVFEIAEESRKLAKKNKIPNPYVHLYVPTHKLADELLTKMSLRYPGLKIGVQKGREKDNCQKYAQIEPYQGMKTIRKAFCDDGKTRCSFIDDCPYMQQFNQDYDVLILAHSYLGQRQNDSERIPELVVIDERFYTEVDTNQHYEVSDLAEVLTEGDIKLLMKSHFDDEELVARTYFRRKLKQFQEICPKEMAHYESSPSDRHIAVKKNDINSNQYTKKAYEFAKVLLSIKANRHGKDLNIKYVEGTFCHITEPNEGGGNRFFDFKKAEGIQILCIDGNAEKIISEQLFDKDVRFVHINVSRNLLVTQCNSKMFTKKLMVDKSLSSEALRSTVAKILCSIGLKNYNIDGQKTLLVSYKALVENKVFTSQLGEQIEIEHFGNIRGIDCYKGYHIIILGRNQPSSKEVVLQALGMFESEECVGDSVFYHQYVEYLGGGVGRSRYFDSSNLNALLLQIREAESLQAIARSRDIWMKSRKEVLLLDSLALDLNVDQNFNWSELNMKQSQRKVVDFFEFHNGIFIKSAKLLSLLTNDNKWKDALKINTGQYCNPIGKYRAKKEVNLNKTIMESEYVSAVFKEITIKLTSYSQKVVCIYDPDSQTEASVLAWMNRHFSRQYGPACIV